MAATFGQIGWDGGVEVSIMTWGVSSIPDGGGIALGDDDALGNVGLTEPATK